jgi:transcriptional regulator with XRE-family HTH domain
VFGPVLRFYRDRAGLTRDELAARAHVSVSTIRAYEEGRRVPTRASVIDIEALEEMGARGALLVLWDQFEEGMSYAVFPDWLQYWAETVEPTALALRSFEAARFICGAWGRRLRYPRSTVRAPRIRVGPYTARCRSACQPACSMRSKMSASVSCCHFGSSSQPATYEGFGSGKCL